jgi:hypothetical protein
MSPIDDAASSVSQGITDREAVALARAAIRLFDRWGLSDDEARVLLGSMPVQTWTHWKNGQIVEINQDLRSRMAVLIGIHKGLRVLFVDPERGYRWIHKPNSGFEGSTALEVMMGGEISDLIAVRDYLDRQVNLL